MLSRRLLACGLTVAVASLASAGSPTYTAIFSSPLPMPPIATPYTSANVSGQQIDFYEVTIESFQRTVFEDLGPANLYGYNGFAPGPTFYVEKGTQTVVRYNNNKSDVSVTHLHGSNTHSPFDGWASDTISTGQFKDYYYPNDENARSLWYHDHSDGITSGNCFKGLTGAYIIYDPAEDGLGLPTAQYDVPLMIQDKMYTSDGDLVDVSTASTNFFGDMIEVNFQPWPYLAVEPRKYRLRLYNTAMSRPFDLHIEQSNGDWLDFQIIASEAGLFETPVPSNDVVIAMAERYEIVVDFSPYSGQNLTMKNTFTQYGIPAYANTDLIMSFVVGETVSDWSSNEVPSTLNTNIAWPVDKTEIDHTFRFQLGGDAHWTINGVDFNDVNNRVLARPPQGTTERWKFEYAGGPGVHPVHVHLVDFQIVSRTGGSRGVLPYESAGLKDIVLIEPGETVEVLAYYGPWNGMYMFHCHNLVHEDHAMMAAFNITALDVLGYDDVEDLGDPMDPRFVAQEWSAEAYSYDNIQSTLTYLGGLGAYNQMTQLASADSAYVLTDPAAASETILVTVATTIGYVDATTTQYYGGYSPTYATPTSTPAVTAAPTPSATQGSWESWASWAHGWGQAGSNQNWGGGGHGGPPRRVR